MNQEDDYKVIRLNALFKCYNVGCPQSYESNGIECMRCMIKHQWETNAMLHQISLEQKMSLAEQLNEGATDEDQENLAVRGLPDIQPKPEMDEEEMKFLGRRDIYMLLGLREWQGTQLRQARKLLEGRKAGELIQLTPKKS